MSTRLIWSVGSAGAVLAIWAVASAVGFHSSRRPKRRHRSANALAERIDVPLPPEFADRLARRLRRRGIVTGMIIGPFFAAWAAWMAWLGYVVFLVPESNFKPHAGLLNMDLSLPVFASVFGLAAAVSHFYDDFREPRDTAETATRTAPPRLSDAIPPILTWAVRAFGLLPPLAGLAWLLAPTSLQHGSDAVHPHAVPLTVAVVGAPLSVAAIEIVQKRILHSRTHTASAQVQAFEDALRVETMLSVLTIPAGVCTLTAILIAAPLEWTHGWSGSAPVVMALPLSIIPLVSLNSAVNAKWSRSHYLRHPARFSGWRPPATWHVA